MFVFFFRDISVISELFILLVVFLECYSVWVNVVLGFVLELISFREKYEVNKIFS